jgi:hypothetical protein
VSSARLAVAGRGAELVPLRCGAPIDRAAGVPGSRMVQGGACPAREGCEPRAGDYAHREAPAGRERSQRESRLILCRRPDQRAL